MRKHSSVRCTYFYFCRKSYGDLLQKSDLVIQSASVRFPDLLSVLSSKSSLNGRACRLGCIRCSFYDARYNSAAIRFQFWARALYFSCLIFLPFRGYYLWLVAASALGNCVVLHLLAFSRYICDAFMLSSSSSLL